MSRPGGSAGDDVLVTRSLGKRFGGFVAVGSVDLAVRRGEIHALIGPNGAGKSTLFGLLSCFLRPTAGRVLLDGRDITGLAPATVARLGMVRSFQISALFGEMTVLENLRIALMRSSGLSAKPWLSLRSLRRFDAPAAAIAESVDLSDVLHEPAATLSYGRRRALELATTLAVEPDVILLDEPLAGTGGEDTARVVGLVREAARGRTVVMVEHNLSVIADLADRVTVLQRGDVLASGTYAEVRADPRVQAAYLGEGSGVSG